MLKETETIIKGSLIFEPFFFSGFFQKQLTILMRPPAVRILFRYTKENPVIVCRNNGEILFYFFYSGISTVEYVGTPSANCLDRCNQTCSDKEDIYYLVEDSLDFTIAKFYSKHHVMRWINSSSVDEIIKYKETLPGWIRLNTRRSSRKRRRMCLRSPASAGADQNQPTDP